MASKKKGSGKKKAAKGKKAAKPKTKAGEPEAKKETVAGYVGALDGWKKKLAKRIVRDMKGLAPESTALIKWSQPVWEDHGPFAYLKAFTTHVNFGFWRGAELDDPDGLLTGKGVKMRHLSLQSEDDYPPEKVAALVRQAIALNRAEGDPSRKAAAKAPAKAKGAKAEKKKKKK